MTRSAEANEVGTVMRAAIAKGESVVHFDRGRAACTERLVAQHLVTEALPRCVVATLGCAWAGVDAARR
jgi:hypothetical protein